VRPFATLRFEKRGAIALVSLDRPEKLNAYNTAMRDDLHAVLGAVHDDPEVRAVILRGRGRAFSTGGDLAEFGTAPSPYRARAIRWQRDVWGRLLRLRAVTVAAVHGYVVGGGMEMALLCDLCIAATESQFFLPETALGMIPGVGGTQTVTRRVGLGRALDLVLRGSSLTAAAAAQIGLINRVVARPRLEHEALKLAAQLACVDPALVQAARRAVRAGHDLSFAAGCALERRLALGLEARR